MLLLVITMEQTPIVTPIDNACVYKMPVSNFRNKLRTIRRLWLDQFLDLFIADFKLNLKLSAPTLSAYEQASLVLEQTERLTFGWRFQYKMVIFVSAQAPNENVHTKWI